MKQIRRTATPIRPATLRLAPLLAGLSLIGCDPPPDTRDQRLAEVAQQSVAMQAQQNEQIARQSQTVAEQSRHLAEAAQQLVAKDAEARQELLSVQEKLTAQLHQQRSAIDAGRDALEEERRQLAAERQRAPIVAASIESLGLVLACLLPLLLCGLLVWRQSRSEPDEAAVAELLVCELTSERPRLLPGLGPPPALSRDQPPPRLPGLTHDSAEEPAEPPF